MEEDIQGLVNRAAFLARDAVGKVYPFESGVEFHLGLGMSIEVAPKMAEDGSCLEEMVLYFVGGMGRYRYELPDDQMLAGQMVGMMMEGWPDFRSANEIFKKRAGI
jgi:hypothetical protein